jgi:hypothetical protein
MKRAMMIDIYNGTKKMFLRMEDCSCQSTRPILAFTKNGIR